MYNFFTDERYLDFQPTRDVAGNDDYGFGPGRLTRVNDNKKIFHLTSLHNRNPNSPNNSPAPVVPVCSGMVIACPIYNYLSDPSANSYNSATAGYQVENIDDIVNGNKTRRVLQKMNLILKPFRQPAFPFPKIKYIVYRNVDVSSFNQLNNIITQTTRVPGGVLGGRPPIYVNYVKPSSGLNMIRGYQVDGAGNMLDPTPAVDPLGYHFLNIRHFRKMEGHSGAVKGFGQTYNINLATPGLRDDQLVDELFALGYGIVVGAGNPTDANPWQSYILGSFANSKFGIEIVVENEKYDLTIGAVRKKLDFDNNNIRLIDRINNTYLKLDGDKLYNSNRMTTDLTGVDSHVAAFKIKLFKEQVLQYIDPCAFYGSFTSPSMHANYAPNNSAILRSYDNTNNTYTAIRGVDIYRRLLFGTNILQDNNKIVLHGQPNYSVSGGAQVPVPFITNNGANNTTVNLYDYYISGSGKSMKGIFANRNKVYVDIRDKHGNSYNLFEHKRTDPNQPIALTNQDVWINKYIKAYNNINPDPAQYNAVDNSSFAKSEPHTVGSFQGSINNDWWPVLCLESRDITKISNSIPVEPHFIPRSTSSYLSTDNHDVEDKMTIFTREKIRAMPAPIGNQLERASFIKIGLQLPTCGDHTKEQYLLHTPLIKNNTTTRSRGIEDEFYEQISIESPLNKNAFTDKNFVHLHYEDEQKTPSIVLQFPIDYPSNIPLSAPIAGMPMGVYARDEKDLLDTPFYIAPISCYYSLRLITIPVAIEAPDANNPAENPVLSTTLAANLPAYTAPQKYPTCTSYEYMDNIFRPLRLFNKITTITGRRNTTSPFICTDVYEDTAYVENAQISGRDMIASIGVAVDNANVATNPNPPYVNTVTYGTITFYANQYREEDILGSTTINRWTGYGVDMMFNSISLLEGAQVPLSTNYVSGGSNEFMEFMQNTEDLGLMNIRLRNLPAGGGVFLDPVPITAGQADSPIFTDNLGNPVRFNLGGNLPIFRYIERRGAEANQATLFVTFSQADFALIQAAYQNALTNGLFIDTTSTGSPRLLPPSPATPGPSLTNNTVPEQHGFLEKWVNLAFVFDERQRADVPAGTPPTGQDIAVAGLPYYSRYKVCLRGFGVANWIDGDGNSHNVLVERLVDTGVFHYQVGTMVDLDGITNSARPTLPSWDGQPNQAYEIENRSSLLPTYPNPRRYLSSKQHLIRDMHMSRQEFYDYACYYKHNIEKVWTTHNPNLNEMIPSNQGFTPADPTTGNRVDVITSAPIYKATGSLFHQLQHTDNLVSVGIGQGRSHQIWRCMKMYATSNDLSDNIGIHTNNAGNPIYDPAYYTPAIVNSTLSIHHRNTPAHEFGHLIGLKDRYAYLAYTTTANPQIIDANRMLGMAPGTGNAKPIHYLSFVDAPSGLNIQDNEYNSNYNWVNNIISSSEHVLPQASLWGKMRNITSNQSEVEYIGLHWNNYPKPIMVAAAPIANRFSTTDTNHNPNPVDIVTVYITDQQWSWIDSHQVEIEHPHAERIFIIQNLNAPNSYNGSFIGHNAAMAFLSDHDVLTGPNLGATSVNWATFNAWLGAVARDDIAPAAFPGVLPGAPVLDSIANRVGAFGNLAAANQLQPTAYVQVAGLYPMGVSRPQLENASLGLLADVLEVSMNLYDPFRAAPTGVDRYSAIDGNVLSAADAIGLAIWNRAFPLATTQLNYNTVPAGGVTNIVINPPNINFNNPLLAPIDVPNYDWRRLLIYLARTGRWPNFAAGLAGVVPFQQFVNRYWLIRLSSTGE